MMNKTKLALISVVILMGFALSACNNDGLEQAENSHRQKVVYIDDAGLTDKDGIPVDAGVRAKMAKVIFTLANLKDITDEFNEHLLSRNDARFKLSDKHAESLSKFSSVVFDESLGLIKVEYLGVQATIQMQKTEGGGYFCHFQSTELPDDTVNSECEPTVFSSRDSN